MTPEERYQKRKKQPLFPYTVPEGYFDGFKADLMNRIHDEGKKKTRVYDVLRPYLYLAAMFIGLALFLNLLPLVSQKNNSAGDELVAEEANQQQFEEYLLDETSDDYWGEIILDNGSNDYNISSSK